MNSGFFVTKQCVFNTAVYESQWRFVCTYWTMHDDMLYRQTPLYFSESQLLIIIPYAKSLHVIQDSWYIYGPWIWMVAKHWLLRWLKQFLTTCFVYLFVTFLVFFRVCFSIVNYRLIWLSHGLLIPMVRLNKPDMMPSLLKRYNLVFTIPKFG